MSLRKNSLEPPKGQDLNSSLLSDSQNMEWLQKRFEKIQEGNYSQENFSCSGRSNAQISMLKKGKNRKNEGTEAPSIKEEKEESARVFDVIKNATKVKISGKKYFY